MRKDAAIWAISTGKADSIVRGTSGAVWKESAKAEKEAAYDYTRGSGKFNRPLSGYRKPYSEGGSGWEEKYFKRNISQAPAKSGLILKARAMKYGK
jgi:hypothetical protein